VQVDAVNSKQSGGVEKKLYRRQNVSVLYPANVASMTDADSGSEAGLAVAGPPAHPLKQIADELPYPLLACVTEQSFGVGKRDLNACDSELPSTSPASSGRR
jgi:hypothetical protein